MQRCSPWALALVVVLSACSRRPGEVRSFASEPYPKQLSEWGLFTGEKDTLQPARNVLPYDLNTPLFSDYADKHRFVWMPAGTSALYRDDGVFDFPAGTVIAKTFAYGGRRIETRLLVHAKEGWVGLPYVWNQEQTDATLELAANPVQIEHRGLKIHYVIPNANQCKGCHENSRVMSPIGPKAMHLNRSYAYADGAENQLGRWSKVGYLKGAPAPESAPRAAVWDDASTGSLDSRARAYLDINCAHCHNSKGPANTSGLFLTASETNPVTLGACKAPVATGPGSGTFRFSILPGHPEQSILIHRMKSNEPKVMMPELGRAVVHQEGLALLEEWIASLKGDCRATASGIAGSH